MRIPTPVEQAGGVKLQTDSTTTPIGSNLDYTGATISGNYAKVRGFVSTDQAGSLYLQLSENGSNWYTAQNQAIAITTPTAVTPFSFDINAAFARIVYVNGATAQTRFKLVTYKCAQ